MATPSNIPTPSDELTRIAEKYVPYLSLGSFIGTPQKLGAQEKNIGLFIQALQEVLKSKETELSDYKENLQIQRDHIEELTAQNERMRVALERASKVLRSEARDITANLCDKALADSPISDDYLLIKRSELEKWKCTCMESVDTSVKPFKTIIAKCPRCLALETTTH